MSDNHHEEAHTGPIKNPKQLLIAVLFSFVIPIFAIIGLVLYVTSADKPAAGAANPEKAIAERIQKIGMVEVRDANRPLKSGEDVFKAQCSACHASGAAGAPKFGDAAAWSARIGTGFEALVQSALKGKGAMAPQGGGDFNDTEIARAVVYMANAAGAKFAEPAAPAGAAAAAAPAAAPATEPAPAATAAAPAPVVAAAAGAGAGEALYKQACQVCHAAGVAGAPKFGDKAAWSARLPAGIDALYGSAVTGKGAMPPRGGSQASDADLRAAVEFMAAAVK
ncbi:cytochrome c5 [Acidovorax sp. 69]|uniref:c-type cytochrome n=1 Tax=Acidovorax sp. 69 TaxID=2035202 RepID=UPI000C241E73|nr:c-type cytochrome [Acidovorax sp. 69]PJI99478.1 cytochrome c5 [Acidovorax sp. 69]